MNNGDDPRRAILDPVALSFLRALERAGGPPIYARSPAEARSVLLLAQASGNGARYPSAFEERTIEVGPTGSVALRIARPVTAGGLLPAIIYLHGGGWVLGDSQTHDRLVRELANGADATVVFVDYSRSPEVKYPVALEQAYGALSWVAENGAIIGVDAARLAVAGDSAGGNLAAVVALLAKQRQGPSLLLQLLFYPVTDANLETGSYNQFADGYWLSKAAMSWFWNSYATTDQRKQPTVAPLQATVEQLTGLPPTLVITAENDVLRDEGENYARKLTQAGVTVTATRYLGAIHDFVMLNALAETPATRAAIAQAIAGLRNAFAHP